MELPKPSIIETTAPGAEHEQLPGGGWHAEVLRRFSPAPAQVAEVTQAAPARFRSLDAFRGLTILLMLLVNNVALDTATPKQLQHASWNAGLTLADYVFPWFLFCVGVAIPFAAASFRRKNLPAWRYDVKVVGRAVTLILLGCLIDSSILRQPHFTLGVLQIIGLAYLVAALLNDLPVVRRMFIAALMLVGYWAAIMFIPVPGVGAGMVAENNNLILHLNRTYLNALSLWGLPSLIPTAALVMIGSGIGELVRKKELRHLQRIAGLLLLGGGLMLAGYLWNFSLPYNKPLWTPSYCLLTAGAGTLLLCIFYLILDAVQWWQWSYPLLVFGSNAIFAYVAPVLIKLWVLQVWHMGTAKTAVDQWLQESCKHHFGLVGGGWCYTIGYIVLWWGVLWVLYRKKVFLRV